MRMTLLTRKRHQVLSLLAGACRILTLSRVPRSTMCPAALRAFRLLVLAHLPHVAPRAARIQRRGGSQLQLASARICSHLLAPFTRRYTHISHASPARLDSSSLRQDVGDGDG